MSDLILTGSTGSGKTSVGRAIAERYGLQFIDTDAEIERRAGCTIAKLWAAHEEPAFRDLETAVFGELMATPGERVIATGAGLLVNERNRTLLHRRARVVALTCDLATLVDRLLPVQAGRPLLAGLSRDELIASLAAREERRRPIYGQFECVDTTDGSIEQVVAEIAARFELFQAARLTFAQASTSRLFFGRGLLSSLGDIVSPSGGAEVMLVTDESTEQLPWTAKALQSLHDAGCTVHHCRIPAGEHHKTIETVTRIYGACLEARLDRSATIIGLGGGVVGDIAGFVAATYLRGLSLVLAPTTLLAQVDAAIGGKVGVDLHGAKNMVGAFHPARAVVIDPDVLTTLPRSALAAGLAEVVKIAWMRSICLLHQVESLATVEGILQALPIVRGAANEKARLVQEDPYERSDRALLNFGHTIGHGLEAASGYSLAHGQAVSVGMVAEARLAEERGWCAPGTYERLSATLRRLELPDRASGLDAALVLEFAGQDKKRRGGRLRLAVPRAPGEGMLVEVEEHDVQQAIGYAVRGES